MMRRSLLVLTLVLPMIAEAQRGGAGGSGAPPIKGVQKSSRGDRANYNGVGGGGAVTISNKDVESLSPVRALLEKKKDLALTDDQVKRLKEMDTAIKTENDTLFDQVDSLRKEMRPKASVANPQVEQLRVRGTRTSMVEVIKAIRANYNKAEPEAMALLDEAQQKTATELLDKHQEEADQMLQEKLGGRRRGR